MKAKSLLGLREKVTLAEIKINYKNLMKKWHPDKHKDNIEKATKMSAQINEAYNTVLEYCNNYEYSFEEDDVKKSTYTPQDWWHSKFGGR